ncbi:MAG: hypothetical protein FJY29_05220 [Betaproteobacteria bacterium]|nr:hypothetical protein [Betaproteobacteria bacterium]
MSSGFTTISFIALCVGALAQSSAKANTQASRGAENFQKGAAAIRGIFAEPQLRSLTWPEVAVDSSAPGIQNLFDIRNLARYAQPAHLSAQMSAIDLGGFLYNVESSLGVDSLLLQLKNREHLRLLPEKPLRAYFGLLHAHTFASDGLGTAQAAFKTARDIAKLDFFAVTDHSEYWFNRLDSHWHEQRNTALQESTPQFVALAGFEYSHTLFGHVVVLNSNDWISALTTPTWKGLFEWLAQPGQEQALAIFAHPGFHRYRNWFDLSHFKFDARVKDKFVGVEFIHKNVWRRSLKGYSGSKSYLDEALQQGWKVGPLASQDNHSAFWGLADGNRIALLMDGLSRENVLEALRARRFYSTQSPQLQLGVGVYTSDKTFLGTLGDTIDARSLHRGGGFVRVRMYDPNHFKYRLCRFDLLVDGEKLRHLTFLNNPSGGMFVGHSKQSAVEEKNCAPQSIKATRWDKLFNNGMITGKPFAWIFDEPFAQNDEALEVIVPITPGICAADRRHGKKTWDMVIRLLHGREGEKLTLTSPMTLNCSGIAAEP